MHILYFLKRCEVKKLTAKEIVRSLSANFIHTLNVDRAAHPDTLFNHAVYTSISLVFIKLVNDNKQFEIEALTVCLKLNSETMAKFLFSLNLNIRGHFLLLILIVQFLFVPINGEKIVPEDEPITQSVC